jgi:hypothetical protein
MSQSLFKTGHAEPGHCKRLKNSENSTVSYESDDDRSRASHGVEVRAPRRLKPTAPIDAELMKRGHGRRTRIAPDFELTKE